ncbi:Rha family transcriptional regulator [Acinetobacter baumannii]|uniref:Rha family transcriptional regulator n=1 Tax=Acinetobacter baumannii TaxID=470 RepID=UPI0002BA402A|nr:Rha family transcriptional regulator [Acinetobacter baumannii]AIS07621.1 DNA-binding protein [Acinetobacter baumannii]MBP4936961.1 Rha family transcriptional regulator [Acinetobacter baumannii]MBP4981606.1 Rha family transcriptional regulator [Acinetobacter baumannii]MDA3587413.1 Rha family transcriptional regulator [Acinetobacter baumannii]NKN68901.1 DNA-binding protein [Acinetobacter baumannii]
MNALVNTNVQTMTSLEISELVQSEHRAVVLCIERLAKRGIIQLSPMVKVENKQSLSPNRFTNVYEFTGEQGKRDSIIVVAQLCPEFTARLVDRWAELEKQVAGDLITLPNFFDPAEAARAWADQYEAKQVAFKERDHAIATKAEISDKKTATAMATASVKSRQAEKLKEQIGESKNYASVKAVEKVAGGKYNWRELKKWCLANGKKIKDIADANYGSVKIYHRDAWKAVYGINLTDYFAA